MTEYPNFESEITCHICDWQGKGYELINGHCPECTCANCGDHLCDNPPYYKESPWCRDCEDSELRGLKN